MDHIETAILNCYGIREAEQNMVFAARLTQHGHTIQSMADLMDLYHQSYSQKTVENIAGLHIQPYRNSWSLPWLLLVQADASWHRSQGIRTK